MAQTTATMTVVNASSNDIIGSAFHWSGDGSDHIASPTPALAVSLIPSGMSTTATVQVRSNHDDYWFWQPQSSSNPVRLQQNLDGSPNACLLITDDLFVVVTSSNGTAQTSLPKVAAV
jgi:hypothetical protein